MKKIDIVVKSIPNETAIKFLKDNKAGSECVFIRPCDEWYGAYYDGVLVGVGGWTQKLRFIEIGGVFVKSEYRGQGIGTFINAVLIADIGNKRIVAYARPNEARILKKFQFQEKQTLRNGTIKMERNKINE